MLSTRISWFAITLLWVLCVHAAEASGNKDPRGVENHRRCTGDSRCIPATECRRTYVVPVDEERRDKVLFNCGFEKLNLLVCCPMKTNSTGAEEDEHLYIPQGSRTTEPYIMKNTPRSTRKPGSLAPHGGDDTKTATNPSRRDSPTPNPNNQRFNSSSNGVKTGGDGGSIGASPVYVDSYKKSSQPPPLIDTNNNGHGHNNRPTQHERPTTQQQPNNNNNQNYNTFSLVFTPRIDDAVINSHTNKPLLVTNDRRQQQHPQQEDILFHDIQSSSTQTLLGNFMTTRRTTTTQRPAVQHERHPYIIEESATKNDANSGHHLHHHQSNIYTTTSRPHNSFDNEAPIISRPPSHHSSSNNNHFESTTNRHYSNSNNNHFESTTNRHHSNSNNNHFEPTTDRHHNYPSSSSQPIGAHDNNHHRNTQSPLQRYTTTTESYNVYTQRTPSHTVLPDSHHATTQRNRPSGGSSSQTQDLTLHPNFRLLPLESCGTIAAGPNRIINGLNATLGQFPWMALLGYKKSLAIEDFAAICGGTLISWKYVLTAAHCVKSSQVSIVRLGEHVISTGTDCDHDGLCAEPVFDFEIEAKIPHLRYGKPYLKNDIGLVRLRRAQPRLFSSYIRPICLPFSGEEPPTGKKLITAGWGINRRGAGSKVSSDVLQMAVPTGISLDECNAAQEDDILKPITESQMCATIRDKHSSVCYGDTGGPLMDIQEGKGKEQPGSVVVQVGILSVGSDDCSSYGSPSIYTRVSYYMAWILDTMHS